VPRISGGSRRRERASTKIQIETATSVTVGQGREYLDPFVAEALLRRLGASGEPGREQRDPERKIVREHVPRIGE